MSRSGWKSWEIDFIADNRSLSSKEIAERLERTEVSILSKRSKLKKGMVFKCLSCGSHLTQQGKYCVNCKIYGRKISQAKYRSSVKKRDYTLEEEEALEILKSDCVYCGSSISIGFDRVDSNIGYTKDNVVPCCTTCNMMKMDMVTEDWMNQMRKILENFNA